MISVLLPCLKSEDLTTTTMRLLQLLRCFFNPLLLNSVKSLSCTGTKRRAELEQPSPYIHLTITEVGQLPSRTNLELCGPTFCGDNPERPLSLAEVYRI